MRSINKKYMGMHLMRPWTICRTSSTLSHALHCVCDRSHDHAPVEGLDTKISENYNIVFAKRFHFGFAAHLAFVDMTSSRTRINDGTEGGGIDARTRCSRDGGLHSGGGVRA